MKTLKFFIIGILFIVASVANAQVSVTVNLGSPPQWGPSGYSNIRYYYLPEIECYYDIQSAKFIYFNGVGWVYRAYLPTKYRNYDLYRGYKVVMTDYRGNKPYTNFREYKRKYGKGFQGQSQRNIGDDRGRGEPNSKEVNTNHSFRNTRYDEGRNKESQQGNNKNTRKNHGGDKGKRK
jgi:hypothetical protein